MSQMEEQLQRMDSLISELHEGDDQLNIRLAGIMRDKEPPSPEDGAVDAPLVALAGSIQMFNRRLGALLESQSSIINRLEL